MKKTLLYIGLLLVFRGGNAQTIDSLLASVTKNNKPLQADSAFWHLRRTELKTGLSLYDPFVEYDYMYGTPVGAGNQQDFAVTQRFDFPTVYSRKKELSGRQITQTKWQQQANRQSILLNVKLLALKAIYLNKLIAELDKRAILTHQLVEHFQQRFQVGELIITDLNKVQLQKQTINNEIALRRNEKLEILTQLQELNGGLPVVISDTAYPVSKDLPEFELLDSMIEASDPLLQVYEQEKLVQQQQIAYQKALNLPKMEAGYRSQGILGQNYRGLHVGVTVPLWENKNRLNAAKAGYAYAQNVAESHRLEHRLTNKQFYDQLEVRKNLLQSHQQMIQSLHATALLSKALMAGQITVIQYFYEESFYYATYDKYLQTELEYHIALVKLLKYQL